MPWRHAPPTFPAMKPGLDPRLDFPSARRNRDPINEVLRRYFSDLNSVLEIASGSGQHMAYFAKTYPHIVFQPSDPDRDHRASIAAWTDGLENVNAPLDLDTTKNWQIASVDAFICVNMIHIAPWSACEGLLSKAGRHLASNGILYLYGPYKDGGRHTAQSNAKFDADLRHRNAEWGIRDLDDITATALAHGLTPDATVQMPANNLSVIYRRVV